VSNVRTTTTMAHALQALPQIGLTNILVTYVPSMGHIPLCSTPNYWTISQGITKLCYSSSTANPLGSCAMDSKSYSPKSSSALRSCSLDFKNFSYTTSRANPLGCCPMDFKYHAPLEANPLGSCLMDWKELRTCKAKLSPLGSS
jgi:hypothetical protein